MKKQHAVILTSSATFIGILLTFGIIEMTKKQKTSQPEPQRIVLNTDAQVRRLQEMSDQYTEAMEEIQKKLDVADPSNLYADNDLGEEFHTASAIFAKQAIAEVRKMDPKKADEMELKLKQMLENNK